MGIHYYSSLACESYLRLLMCIAIYKADVWSCSIISGAQLNIGACFVAIEFRAWVAEIFPGPSCPMSGL